MLIRTVAALALVLAMAHDGRPAGDGLEPGAVLDRTTAGKAEALLPPEILAHYRDGGYANRIEDWPAEQFNWPTDHKAASTANAGRFALTSEGAIVEKATGRQPAHILGDPFPQIDRNDPQAATKILWNYFYRFWYFGSMDADSQFNWIGARALERRSNQRALFYYYDGVPEAERTANPQNFLMQQLSAVTSPADLQGTAALTWRYRDPGKRDSTWTYVPALRRVRAVSPANRSDGFLGSDMSQDDAPFFDGKPEDFTWTLKGEQDELRLVDGLNLKGSAKAVWLPQEKAWDVQWPEMQFVGYTDPAWRGLAWAPIGEAVLARRPTWIIEGVPKDKYYLYGKVELHIDKVAYAGAWNRKFGWNGEELAVVQVLAWNPIPFTRPDGKEDWLQGSNQAFQCVENLKLNRATVAGLKSSPNARFATRVRFDLHLFDIDTLSRWGK